MTHWTLFSIMSDIGLQTLINNIIAASDDTYHSNKICLQKLDVLYRVQNSQSYQQLSKY